MPRTSTVLCAKWEPPAWCFAQKYTWNGTLMKTACLLVIILSLLTINCSLSPNRYHSDYARHRPSIRRILILPPEINFYTSAKDTRPIRQETQSRHVERLAHDAIIRTLADQGFMANSAGNHLLKTKEADSLRSLYRNVHRSIRLHAYGPQVFPAKTKNFDYAVGDVSNLLEPGEADALLLVMGKQIVSDDKNKIWISMAVVEPKGSIIWYGIQGDISPKKENLHGKVVHLVQEAIQPFMDGAS